MKGNKFVIHLIMLKKIIEQRGEETDLRVSTRSDTKRPAVSHEQARSLQFRI